MKLRSRRFVHGAEADNTHSERFEVWKRGKITVQSGYEEFELLSW